MSYQPWNEQEQGDYQHEQEAQERAAHLKLVHNAALSGEETSDADIHRLAVDFADTTAACNFILARYAATSKKFYDPSKRVRDFLCAVIGATGGRPDYVEVSDKDLAAQMGCSTRTLATARDEFRSWPDHAKVLGIKDHYQPPDGESHPHAYLCRLTMMSAAATADARVGVEMREAARIEADPVAGFVNRPPKRRRKATDSEMVPRELRHAAETLRKATARKELARHLNYDEMVALRRELADSLAALDEAYGFQSDFSTQKKEEEQSEKLGGEQPDEPGFEPRVEVSFEDDAGGVEKFSTPPELVDSTTYAFDESDAGPPFDLSDWVWVDLDGLPDYKLPPPGRFSSEADDLIVEEFERLRSASKGVSHATG